MEIDGWDLLKWILIILAACGIIYGIYWLCMGLWWAWFTSITWFLGIFGKTITGWQAFALLIFWIVFFPGIKLITGPLISYKKEENKTIHEGKK